MAPMENGTNIGALSRWPRRLALLSTAIAVVGVAAQGVVFGGWGSLGAVVESVIGLCVIGGVVALLARPGEANPWRTAGVWATLLAYIGAVSDGLWVEGWNIVNNTDVVSAGFWFGLLMDGAFVLAALYTLGAYAVTCLRARRGPRRAAPTTVPGVQLGAAALVPFLAAFGLLFAFPPSQPSTARSMVVVACYALATLAVALGTVLQARGVRRAGTGRALLWSGAVVLLIGGALDSFAATSLSGLSGYYPYSNTHFSGLGVFVLPAGVAALVAAIGGTLPRRQGRYIDARGMPDLAR